MYFSVGHFEIEATATNLTDASGTDVVVYPAIPITIMQFGMVVTTAFGSSVSTFKLQLITYPRTEWGAAVNATLIAELTPTAASGNTVGNFLVYTGPALPYRVDSGKLVVVKHIAGTSVTGAGKIFLVYRQDGLYIPNNPISGQGGDPATFGFTS